MQNLNEESFALSCPTMPAWFKKPFGHYDAKNNVIFCVHDEKFHNKSLPVADESLEGVSFTVSQSGILKLDNEELQLMEGDVLACNGVCWKHFIRLYSRFPAGI